MSQKPDWLQPIGDPWRKVGEPRPKYENGWISVTEYDALAPTGAPALYGVVSFHNLAIAVLPLHDDGAVTLVGQHRFATPGYSWELPEGGSPKDEDPLEGARRELLEETGLVAEQWLRVLDVHLSNSITDERAVGYVAYGLHQAEEAPEGDDTEELARVRVPFSEALEAALGGHLQDALTVAMLLRAYHMAREGALPGELAARMLG
jgi:8-oxo-dGTP pyrophosphatase MutT (NUDIX family)